MLKRIISSVIIMLVCCYCQTEYRKTSTDNAGLDTSYIFDQKNDTVPMIDGDWESTLKMYAQAKRTNIRGRLGTHIIKIFELNGQKTGLVIDGQVLRLYKFIKTEVVQTFVDSIVNGSNIKIRNLDVNLDGFKDVILSEVQGAHGNAFTYALIYDPVSNTLKHNGEFDLSNIMINKKDSLIKSKWWSSVCGNSRKSVFKVRDGNIHLLKSVVVTDLCLKSKSIVLIVTNNNGSLKTDSITTNAQEAWKIFTKTGWNTETSWGERYNTDSLYELY